MSPAAYAVPGPVQVTVVPSPIAHAADTGVAVAVTASPGTCAVFDCGCHTFAATHSHTGSRVSCSAPGAGEERITGSGSCRYFTASWASTPGAGSTGAAAGRRGGTARPRSGSPPSAP